jgi:hypothetical protein
MSQGIHSGQFNFFAVGTAHRELPSGRARPGAGSSQSSTAPSPTRSRSARKPPRRFRRSAWVPTGPPAGCSLPYRRATPKNRRCARARRCHRKY